jgi:transitional endoplasmic reticulum ATPase
LCTCGFCREIERSGRAHFIAVQCSRLLSSIVGESEKQVAAIFRQARQLAPCVLFLDQIECVAAKRSVEGGASGGARVGERVRATFNVPINYL